MSGPFLDALKQLIDEKVHLIDELATSLEKADDSEAAARTLRAAANQLQDFFENVERPFESRYSSHLESPEPEALRLLDERRGAINSLISTLQRLKYDRVTSVDPEIASAIAEFETATCHIPSPQ